MRDKVHGTIIRERGARLRSIGAELSLRFRAAQTGTVRPGLTLEDGTLVVTDNYLKVRIAPGIPRNQRVDVRIGKDSGVAEVVQVAQTFRSASASPGAAPAISAASTL